jgi:fimbrial chaperone protein
VFRKIVSIFLILILSGLMLSESIHAASQKGLQPQLAISPSRVEFNTDEVRSTKSVTVLNLGSEPMSVEVSVQNWDFDENNNYRALPPTPQSLDQWLIINPVRLTIPAKSQQTVRMAIRPKAKPMDGEHRAMIFFKQQQKEHSKGVNVQFNVGVPVYAFFGETIENAVFHGMSYSKESQELTFDLTNKGNVYIRPEGVFRIVGETSLSDEELLSQLKLNMGESQGKYIEQGKLNSKPVFAGERRTVKSALPLTKSLPDDYALVLKVDIAGTVYEKVYRVTNGK